MKDSFLSLSDRKESFMASHAAFRLVEQDRQRPIRGQPSGRLVHSGQATPASMVTTQFQQTRPVNGSRTSKFATVLGPSSSITRETQEKGRGAGSRFAQGWGRRTGDSPLDSG